nr:restriction endonuclease subunit S [uncultured Niameybacter sp.]
MKNSRSIKKLGEYIKEVSTRNKQELEIPVLSVTNNRGFILSEEQFSKQVYSSSVTNYKIVSKNQIAYNPSRINVGSIAVLEDYDQGLISPLYTIFETTNGLNPRYLLYYLKSNEGLYYIKSKATGSVRDIVKIDALKQLNIYVPDIDEQSKIVEILDKVNKLIDKRKKQIEICNELIKFQFIEMFGDTVQNEKAWEVKQLQEIGTWKSGGTPSRSNHEYFKGEIDWYSAGELNKLYLEGSIEKITQQAIEESSAKIFNKGSMLVGMYDTAAFKMGILKKDSASNQACANVMPNESVNIVWLYYNLMHMKEHFLSNRRGIRQKNLNLGMIKEFDIPVPPIELQNQFAEFVQRIDKLKFEMEKSLTELENNFNALIQKAFKGELF